jgi:diguanylate cyclase (GGDEF)-like protein
MDLDYFKNYNDINGHQQGDGFLKKISELISEHVPNTAISSRYGGEEFAVILPDITGKEALKIGETIRMSVEEYHFPGEEYLPNAKLTISVGVSTYPDNAKSEVELIKFADEALYRAKFLSKNSVQPYYSVLDDLQRTIENENDLEP